ncbi:hypothetical protein LEMLEM_LOCUS27059, partial [Lemmus lemmus]
WRKTNSEPINTLDLLSSTRSTQVHRRVNNTSGTNSEPINTLDLLSSTWNTQVHKCVNNTSGTGLA